jgi:chemotaxis protein methyltransferase CheR
MTTSQTVDFLKAIKKESGLLLGRRDLLMLEAAVARRTDCRNRGDRNDLLEQLTSDPSGRGLSHLIAELAPGVTGFFRDREHFDFIARFLRNRAAETTSAPRLWSAGCSTGEEVYSLAMTLHPLLGEIGLKTEILGTDINPIALRRARAACYSMADLAPVSPALAREYFSMAMADGRLVAAEAVRRMVRFREHNLAALPYKMAGPFAVVLCRHTLMYFDDALQSRVIRELRNHLEPDGLLVTGHQEDLLGIEEHFRKIEPGVYRRLSAQELIPQQRPIRFRRNEATA